MMTLFIISSVMVSCGKDNNLLKNEELFGLAILRHSYYFWNS